MSAANRKLVRVVLAIVVAFVLFGCVVYAVSRYLISQHPAYVAGLTWLRKASFPDALVQPVREVRMSLWDDASVEEEENNGKESGQAEFTVELLHGRGPAKVRLHLGKEQGSWRVVKASLVKEQQENTLCAGITCGQ